MATFASHPRASQWSDRNTLKPKDIPLYSQKEKYWFKCDKCPHEFETLVYTVTKLNTWCSYCSNKKLCKDKECIICFNKSFASSEKVEYLTEENTIIPRNVFKSCNINANFNCKEDHPNFRATLNNISNGKWCKLCGYKSSKEKQSMTLDKFLKRAKEKYKEFYDYSKVIMNGVDRPVIIICKIHGEFNQTPWNHYTSDLGGCPTCTIIKRGESNRYTFEEFVELAKAIHGDKFDYSTAEFVYETFDKEIPILCKIHGEFLQKPLVHLRACGCPYCVNKTEAQLLEYLKKKNIVVQKQFKLDSCRNVDTGRYLPFDFYLPDYKTIIELDGRQHFKQVSNWQSPEEQIKRDIYKMKKAEEAGYKIIRIFQEDVYNNDDTWLDTHLLAEIQKEDRVHVFISSIENLYDEHINLY